LEGIPAWSFLTIMASYAVGALAAVPVLAAAVFWLAGRGRVARWLLVAGVAMLALAGALFLVALLGPELVRAF
jgi:hypothetical protein